MIINNCIDRGIMKKVKVYSLHPFVNNIDEFIKHYKFEPMVSSFDME